MAKATMVNWNTLEREFVRKGIERVGFRGENVIMVMNWVEPNIQVNPHQHDFEQLAICVQGRLNYHVGDEVFEMTPGSMAGTTCQCETSRSETFSSASTSGG